MTSVNAVFAVAIAATCIAQGLNYNKANEYLLPSCLYMFVLEVIIWFIYTVIVYPKLLSPLRHLPTAPNASFINGHEYLLGVKSTGEAQAEWANEVPNDGLIRYMSWFNVERLLLTSPQTLAEVLVTNSYDFIKPEITRARLGQLLGFGVLLAEGHEHKRQRKILAPAFAHRHIQELTQLFWTKSCELVEAMKTALSGSGDGSGDSDPPEDVIVPRAWFSRATIDIIGIAGMGRDFGVIRNDNVPVYGFFRRMLRPVRHARLLRFLSTLMPIWLMENLPLRRNSDIVIVTQGMRQICRQLIADKKTKLDDGEPVGLDILSVALKSGGFTQEELVDQLMTFLAAGSDTTAGSMSWAAYLLSKNRVAQSRLREEIKSKLPSPATSGVQLTSADLDECHYLKAVCNEVLRVRPPVPLLVRNAAKDTTINGQFVPKGTKIAICAQAINNSTKLWGPDAGDFNPDRWMAPGQANRGGADSNYSFLTFIHGPRSCIGQSFARAEFACLLAAFIGRFEVELDPPDAPLEISGELVQRPMNKVRIKLADDGRW